MLVGQALASANLCSQCGETLRSAACEMEEKYHEKPATHGGGTVPICHADHVKNGGACPEEEPEREEEEGEDDDSSTS